MNRNIFESVRLKLILYSGLSFILTLITEAIITVLIYIISSGAGSDVKGYGMNAGDIMRIESSVGKNYSISDKSGFGERLNLAFGISPNMLTAIIIFLILAGIFFFILYFSIFSGRFMRDLSKVSVEIKNISSGDMIEKLEVNRNDEIGDIADSVNEMIDKINELVKSEREALKTNKDLITCVAHDLRTPLTSVIGYIKLAVDEEKYSQEERKNFADIATEKAKRLESLIEDLFTYTKFMSGEIKPMLIDIDIVRLVEQMIEEFYPIFDDNNLEISYKKNANACKVNVDPQLIARVLSNLLSNAVKYGKDGKRIDIIYKLFDEGMYISVTNFGIVIPEESIGHVFEKFYRVEDSRSTKTGGTGLGLNIALEIVRLHGGDITVTSDITGTTFKVFLPASIIVESDEPGKDIS
ncbi:MAG: HAMP domain-containing histidine kinase [Lachnospiraceae bacterium]|nr:HAMP domain-containing histidine kinase [Lachnospiraceae bacterium]